MFVGSVNNSVNEDVGTKHGSDLEGEELSLGVTLYILIYGLTGIYQQLQNQVCRGSMEQEHLRATKYATGS